VHEVAEPAPSALCIFILPTARFAKVGDWREFGVQWSACIPSVVEVVHGSLRFGFPFVSCIDIANKVVTDIVTHVKLQEMPKLRQFAVQILVHSVKPLLQLLLGQLADAVMGRVVVDVR